MHPEAQVEAAHGIVQPIEVWVMEQPLALDGPHEHTDGTVVLAPRQHVQRVRHTQQRQHTHPADPVAPLLPDVRHPAVVGRAQRHFDLGLVGDLLDEDGWVRVI